MKIDRIYSLVALTHDLTCAFNELSSAARRFTLPAMLSSDRSIGCDLVRAAVALTIQLAIDVAERDPTEMRALERELVAALEVAS